MKSTTSCSNFYTKTSSKKSSLFFILLLLPFTTPAALGPSVNERGESLNSNWSAPLKVTNCDQPPPQDSICMQEHNGKIITVTLFGQPVNMNPGYNTVAL